jgi:hypothetical protein
MNLMFDRFHRGLKHMAISAEETTEERQELATLASHPLERAKILLHDVPYMQGFEFGWDLACNNLLRLPHERCFFQLSYRHKPHVWGIFIDQIVRQNSNENSVGAKFVYMRSGKDGFEAWPVSVWSISTVDDKVLWDFIQPKRHDKYKDRVQDIHDVVGTLIAICGFLNFKGLTKHETAIDAAINARRVAAGKKALHSYTTIRIDPDAENRRTNLGGSHASPAPHWRRGHVRRLGEGRLTVVRPCIVNSTLDALPPPSNYIVRAPNEAPQLDTHH